MKLLDVYQIGTFQSPYVSEYFSPHFNGEKWEALLQNRVDNLLNSLCTWPFT